jgi:hypothetical protein
MDWSSVLGGAIVGLVAVVPVAVSNWATRKGAREAAQQGRSENVLLRLQGIKADLRSADQRVALDAVDELKQLAARVNSRVYRQEDRDAVWSVWSSRVAASAQRYSEQAEIDVQVRNELEDGHG